MDCVYYGLRVYRCMTVCGHVCGVPTAACRSVCEHGRAECRKKPDLKLKCAPCVANFNQQSSITLSCNHAVLQSRTRTRARGRRSTDRSPRSQSGAAYNDGVPDWTAGDMALVE
eukprot:2196073-Prymnesium_polylepis.1